MATKIEIECRVQYLCNGEWKTIKGGDELTIAIEGDMVNALAGWVQWIENSDVILDLNPEFCAVCSRRLNEGGHAQDCVYAASRAMLAAPEKLP